ncbi:VOC family protein [Streptomyces sp. NPDC086091]|uniref:VOC family protein n=1 Tax=Streptomyces sp. NPDC086091 TaxID=3365751 RepID=UPI0037F81142
MLTTRFVDGAPNWLDVGTADLERARDFYGALFDWRFRSAGPDAGGYGFFQVDGRTVAGGMQIRPEQGPPSWTVYFRTSGAEDTCEAAERAHGRVLFPPMDVMGQGVMAILADPAGAPFGLWQRGDLPGIEVTGEAGALCWVELHTPDMAAAAAFYRATLGLETSAVAYPEQVYTTVAPPGADDDGAFGGLVTPDEEPAGADAWPDAHWLAYLQVADVAAVAARTAELGGGVRLGATDIAGVGTIAHLSAPDGARFAVIRPDPRQS